VSKTELGISHYDWTVKYLIPVLLVALLCAPYLNLETEAVGVLTGLAGLAALVLVLRYKQLLLFTLAFVIPLSFPATVAGGSNLSFPSELIALLLTAFFILKLLLGARPSSDFLKHPITVLLLLDLAWLIITSAASGLPFVSFKRVIIRLIYDVSFYYFMFELFKQDKKNIVRLIFVHLFALLIPTIYTLVRHANMKFVMVGSQQISAPFYFDHTIYGAILVFYVPFLIGYWLQHRRQHINYLSGTLLFIFIPAIYLSFSRAAWLSLIIALVIFSIVHFRITKKQLVYVGVLLALIFAFNADRFSNLFRESKQVSHTNDVTMHIKSVSNISTDASNKERINRWKCAIRMFADKPLMGFGPGTYQFFYGPYQQRHELTRISTFTGNKGHAHSEYLNYLSETGLPGLLIFIGLLVAAGGTVKRLMQRSVKDQWLTLSIACCLITFIVHAFFNGFLEFDKVAMPVFSCLAALCYLDLQSRSNEPESVC
jgi:O-antigen ligase